MQVYDATIALSYILNAGHSINLILNFKVGMESIPVLFTRTVNFIVYCVLYKQ